MAATVYVVFAVAVGRCWVVRSRRRSVACWSVVAFILYNEVSRRVEKLVGRCNGVVSRAGFLNVKRGV